MTEQEKRQYVAACLGLDPNAPETWPEETLDWLLDLYDARGLEAMMKEINKLLGAHR